jgi:hypothetical protein
MVTKKKTTSRKLATRRSGAKGSIKRLAARPVAPAKNGKPKAKRKEGDKLSAIDAAAKVLGESKESLTTKEMIDAMQTKGYWKSPGGKTPDRTLYSAILREIVVKKAVSRFKKTERGKFTINKK